MSQAVTGCILYPHFEYIKGPQLYIIYSCFEYIKIGTCILYPCFEYIKIATCILFPCFEYIKSHELYVLLNL